MHSECLDASEGEYNHSDKHKAVAKARNLRFAVSSVGIPDGDFYNFEIEFGGSENEIEIPEWIEIAKVGTPGL
jgi:hypothetical protein